MTNQTMPRSEWVLSQLLTWQNLVSSPVPPSPYFLPGAISF